MPQYFLTMPHDSETEPTMESMAEADPAELEAVMAAVGEFNAGLQESGSFVHAAGLHPPSTAVTVDASGESATRSDGPFVEAPSYVGGFWVIETPDRETAIGHAETISKALSSRIEVREVQ